MPLPDLCFITLGAAVVLCFTFKVLEFFKLLFPKAWHPIPKSLFPSLGEWAVITGGSEGIGRAYAMEMAKRGLNVVIISRSLEKLQKAAKEIGEATGQEVKVVVADFTEDNIYEHLEKILTDLNVGVLVNNVGILPSRIPCRVLETKNLEQWMLKLVNCNIKSLMKMCRIVLPGMEIRGKGLILNISSGVAGFPCPLYTIYGASKVCIERFSRGLQAEYKSRGIIIQAVTPFGVSTPMTGYQKPNMITFTADDFVRSSLNYVMAGDRTHGSISHQILGWILQVIPIQVLHSDILQEKFLEFLRKRIMLKTEKNGCNNFS